MKLLILLPCLLVGNAFATGYVGQGMLQSSVALSNSVTSGSMPQIDPQYPFGHIHVAMSYLAFAAIIKYQFPGHNDLDSLTLATRAVQAYPVYAPFVTFPAK